MPNREKVYKVLTESGTEYHIGNGWAYNGYFVGSIWHLQVADLAEGATIEYPWRDTTGMWRDVEVPEIGKHMYIAGKDEWRITTPIKSIEEITYD